MMNRAFTAREKALLLILTVLVLITGYIKIFHEPVQDRLAALEDRQAVATDALLIEQIRLAQKQAMEEELAALKAAGTIQDAEIPVYDNVERVMVQLNAILVAAEEYSLTFQEVTLGQDELLSRPIQMTFSAKSYQTARGILDDLYHCPYRCVITDLTVSAAEDIAKDTPVDVGLTVVFYEKNAQ